MKITAPRPSPSTPAASAANPGARPSPANAAFSSSMNARIVRSSGLGGAALGEVDQRALVDDAAVEELDLAVRVVGITRVVRDHADGRAFAVQLTQQVHDRLAVPRVQVACRLVREKDCRLARERAGDSDALLLAAGELRRVVVHAVRHADALERVQRRLAALFAVHAFTVGERQLDVLQHRQVADQVEGLEDEADALVPDLRARGASERRDVLAVEQVLALGRRIEEAEQREQGRLAAARRAGDREELAFRDVEVNTVERVRLEVVGVEDLGDGLEADHGWILHRHAPLPGGVERVLQSITRRSLPDHCVVSGRATMSPGSRPSSTTIWFTDAFPNFTGTRSATESPGFARKTVVVESDCAPTGRPTKRTFLSVSMAMVPSTERSARACVGSGSSKSTSTLTAPAVTAGSTRTTRPRTSRSRMSTTAGSPEARSRASSSGIRSSA